MATIIIPANGARQELTIFGTIESWNFFCATDAEDAEVGGKANAQKSIPGHQRRRGPSDTNPMNILQSQAEYLVDPSLKSGNALPGYGFTLKTTENADVDEQRSFTFKGRSMDLIEYLDRNVNYETYIYLNQGGRHTLAIDITKEGSEASA
jgi:hypothetical protein